MPPCGWGIYIGDGTIFLSLFTLFSCIKRIVQSCEYAGLSGLDLQSNGATYVVLIAHHMCFLTCQMMYIVIQTTGIAPVVGFPS